MNKTGYLIFEIGRECNLGHIHTECPNRNPERYSHVDTSQVMSDDTIVDTAVSMIQEHGFRGMIGFHYYNEPTLESLRMYSLIDGIRKREPSARFVLWTNGQHYTLPLPGVNDFEQIHVTDYGLASRPGIDNCLGLPKDVVHVHRWPLDDRLTATGNEPGRPESDAPCCRMFTEMICDYYGNVHLCCYDWRGLGTYSNIHTRSLDMIVDLWQQARKAICGSRMAPSAGVFALGDPQSAEFDCVPDVCRTCTAPGRSPHITNFVKAPAEAARAYREEELSREQA